MKSTLASLAAFVVILIGITGRMTAPTNGTAIAPTATAAPTQQGAQKIAVTEPEYDDIGAILTALNMPFTDIKNTDLANLQLIKQYDVIFINCAEAARDNAKNAAPSLEQFVREGGKLYASDFAYEYIADAFPGNIVFLHIAPYAGMDDFIKEFPDEPYSGVADQHVTADIVDSDLRKAMGSSTVNVYYDLPFWVPIDTVTSQVHVYLTGSFKTLDGQLQKDKPLTVSFSYQNGAVLYTSYHNELKSQGVSEEQKKLLQYLVGATIKPPSAAGSAPGLTNTYLTIGGILACLLCLGVLVVAAAIAGFFFIRKRQSPASGQGDK